MQIFVIIVSLTESRSVRFIEPVRMVVLRAVGWIGKPSRPWFTSLWLSILQKQPSPAVRIHSDLLSTDNNIELFLLHAEPDFGEFLFGVG